MQYDAVEKVESEISQWLRGRFLKERMLFGEMIELMLESFKPLGGQHKGLTEDKLALLALASRMFNDCEGAKLLLLWGLPDQALPVIRDVIECSLLFRLFLIIPKTAKRWLMSLAEYQPGAVSAKLVELGVDAKEYSMYGPMSHLCHSNLLASLSHMQEIDAGDKGTLRVAHFGSSRTPETEYFVQQFFLELFFLMYNALKEPLAELYYQHTDSDVFETWYEKVDSLLTKLEDLTSEITAKPAFETYEENRIVQDLVNKKMRFKEFKRKLS